MRNRRGLTMIELLVAMVLVGIMGITVLRMLRTMQRVSNGQMQQVDMQSNVRSGLLAIPAELREVGYDSLIAVSPGGIGAISSDLEALGATSVQFKAARGVGLVCQFTWTGVGVAATLTDVRISSPFMGYREPRLTDSYLVFVERERNGGGDDQWLPLVVTDVDLNSNCGATPAIKLTTGAGAPLLAPGGASIVSDMAFPGAPVRYFERMEYGTVVNGGRAWLGARSLSASELTLTPVLGPLQDPGGFALRYFDIAGTLVPAGGDPRLVRRIEIAIRGETTGQRTLTGGTPNQRGAYQLVTQVALRNTLRQ